MNSTAFSRASNVEKNLQNDVDSDKLVRRTNEAPKGAVY